MRRIYRDRQVVPMVRRWKTFSRPFDIWPTTCASSWSSSRCSCGIDSDARVGSDAMEVEVPRRRSHGSACQCRKCLKRIEYARRWHERVTRMYRWALAYERAQHAWADPRAQRRQAHAVACAWARELSLSDVDRRERCQGWAEVAFDVPADLLGLWEWTVAEGPKESA